MTFSLLCPTRRRSKRIDELFLSLQETIINNRKNEIEILLAMDKDDGESHTIIEEMIKRKYKDLNISIHERERTEFLNNDYYNWLIQFAKGKYLWAIADDLIFKVNDWNQRIEGKVEGYIKSYKDRIMCAGIKDSTPPPKRSLPNFPCFPLVTREAYNFFGFILHPDLPTWGADLTAYELYNGCNRYLRIDDELYLDHVSWHTRAMSPDETQKNIQQIFGRLQHVPKHNVDNIRNIIVPQQIKKFKQYIQSIGGRF